MIKDTPFTSIGKISVEYISSDSSDDNDCLIQENNFEGQNLAKFVESVHQLYPAIAENKINMAPAKNTQTKYHISDKEYDLNSYSVLNYPDFTYHLEPISLVISQYVYVDKYLDGIHKKSQVVLGWTNVKNAAPSDYQTVMQNYIKTSFASIRARIKQLFILAPTADKLSSLANTRVEQMCNRILYQYNGFGFPEITDQYMWCSDKRMLEFTKYKLSDLFTSLKPPTALIFDCNNAEVVIDTFCRIAKQKSEENMDDVDWNDWICLCAMSRGEVLPADPILPKDIFTNFLLTPIRAMILFIIIKYFRGSFMIENFPVEMPLRNLWDESHPDAKCLKDFFVAIVDSIACDGIENSLYTRLFRKEISIAKLFRNFLLAQHYMSFSRMHPKCYPVLPDLSLHPLWEHFDHLILSAISNGAKPIKIFIDEFYDRLINTVTVYMNNSLFTMIKPYQLSLLFHLMMKDENDSRPIEILARYATNSSVSHKRLVNASLFPVLITRLVKAEIHSKLFHDLSVLILSLLYHNPNFQSEVQNEPKLTILIDIIFDKTVIQETRTIVTAIVSFLVITYDRFLRICNEQEFLIKLTEELKICPASQAFWLMMLAKRTFELYSPSPSVIVNIGLHVQVSAFLVHNDPMIRNAALSVLTAFMQPFESTINGQLLYMCLHLVCDTSVFTRFHLLQMIKKYILGLTEIPFDCLDDARELYSTFSELIEVIYDMKDAIGNPNMTEILLCIDDFITQDNFISESFFVCYDIVQIMINDPHPEIRRLADLIITYLKTRASADDFEESDSKASELIEDSFEPPDLITYGDDIEGDLMQLGTKQNEALFFTALRNLLHVPSPKNDSLSSSFLRQTPTVITNYELEHAFSYSIFKDDESVPITCAGFTENGRVVSGTSKGAIFSDKSGKRLFVDFEKEADFVLPFEIDEKEAFIFTTNDGCIYAWEPGNYLPLLSFRAIPDGKSRVFTATDGHKCICTVGENKVVSLWNIHDERLVTEKTFDFDADPSCVLDTMNNRKLVVGFSNGTVKEFSFSEDNELVESASKQIEEGAKIIKLDSNVVEGKERYYALTESGIVYIWETLDDVKSIPIEGEHKYTSFYVHKKWPMIILSPETDSPFSININGEIINNFTDIPPKSICTVHKTLPIVGFVSPKGEVSIFQLKNL